MVEIPILNWLVITTSKQTTNVTSSYLIFNRVRLEYKFMNFKFKINY